MKAGSRVSGGASLAEIESVYRRRLDDFVRTAAAMTGGLDSGRDAVHDGFVAAVKGRGRYRGSGTVEAWLWRAVVTSALKARRSDSAVLTELAEVPESRRNGSPDETADVQAAIALLPERQRLVLFLRYYADLDYAAIGEVLNIRPGTVGAALNVALGTLRRRLEEVTGHV
jgi:RNA polymerase sigma factor (sigma-70 family)